jgi:dienelactone hydrolase
MSLSASLLLSVALSTAAHAAVQTKTIEYKVGDRTFEAFLAYDDTKASESHKAPGILVCPEWWGNNEYAHSRARQLAELGYVALSIDMYGKDGSTLRVTTDPAQAGAWAGEVNKNSALRRERAVAGLKVLTSQPQTDTGRLAAIGYCMGGTVALELARTGADLAAVVSFHASTLAAAPDTAAADNKKIKGSILICHGQDDTFVSDEQIKSFHAQMKDANIDYQFTSYANSVHAFTNKGADALNMKGVKYNAAADHRSWESMKSLFAEKFNTPAKPASDVATPAAHPAPTRAPAATPEK